MTLPTLLFRAADDFQALRDANRILAAEGFSVGVICAGNPIGILHGTYAIQKWSNLSDVERRGLHGDLLSDPRRGPITATLYDSAPPLARRAFARAAAVVAGVQRDQVPADMAREGAAL